MAAEALIVSEATNRLGIAGAGKTTIMDAARQAWEAQGFVPAGASAAAVASWLTGIRTGGPGLNGVDVLVVDEAAMCDDRDIAELLAHAAGTGTKVVGIGDPEQLHSPGIGGSFAAVHHLVGGLALSQNFRQKDAIERRALELWRDDNKVEALRAFVGTGRVHALADKDATVAAMLTLWADKRAAHDAERRVLVEWREETADGPRDVAEWVDADYIAQGGLSLGYAITCHKSQGLSVQEALDYGPGS
ncbi:AAA family ATPase [Streptomyces sp. NPDC093085]|uniref:AAA family ATPase n=1 Tax=Streptomyces sp. NPDC093085 TaxID=3155068 RepID=UPI003426D687